MKYSVYWTLFYSIIFFVSTLTSTHAQERSEPVSRIERANCRSRMSESQLTVQGITEFAQSNPNFSRDPGAFMCCLPNSLYENIAAANGSVAGQPGTPNDPRVFAYGFDANRKPTVVMSINGGHEGMGGAHSVEAMVNEGGEVVLLDINFSTRPPTVTRNPEFCLNCHGVSSGTPGGPRLIFEPFNAWTSFVNATVPCSEEERRMQNAASLRNNTVMSAKGVFRCLNDTASSKTPGTFNTVDLDLFTRALNRRRVSNIIAATPNYARYKYAIVGSAICTGNSIKTPPELRLPSKVINNSARFIADWLPPHILSAHNSTLNVRSEVASLESRSALNRVVQDKFRRDRLSAEGLKPRQRALAADPRLMNNERLPIANTLAACMTDEESVAPILNESSYPNLTFMRYAADTAMRTRRGDLADPTMRFLFEARGVSMWDWGMGVTPGDYGSTKFDVAALLAREPDPSPMRELFARFGSATEGSILKTNRDQFCAALKQLSLEAFGPPPTISRPQTAQ